MCGQGSGVIVAVARFCGNCGAELREGAPWCTQCGAEVKQAAGFVGQAEQDMMLGARESLGYAGFWPRLLALLVDSIVLSIVTQPISLLIGSGLSVETTEDATGNVTNFDLNADWTRIALVFGLTTVIYGAYFIIAISRWGQTLGALALSLKVMHPNGELLSPARAAVRWIGAFVSSIPLGLGYLWMIWDRRKQTWHDKFAGSVVVKVKRRGEV